MCSNNEEMMPSHSFFSFDKRRRPRRSRIQVHRLARWRGEQNVEKDMELQNWKLYFENRTIIEENEKLRKKANLLHQENLALLLEFQKKFLINVTTHQLIAQVQLRADIEGCTLL